MPTLQDRAAQHSALLQALGQLEILRPDDLRRADLPEEYNFEAGLPYLEETWRLYRDLAQTNLDRASFSLLNRLNSVAQQSLGVLQQMKSFNPANYGVNAHSQREVILQQLRDNYDGPFDQVMTARAILTKSTSDATQLEGDAQRVLARIDELFRSSKDALETKVVEAENALATVRQSVIEAGVAQHAVYFKAEADEHLKASKNWLRASIGLAMLTLAFGVWSYVYHLQIAPTLAPWIGVQITVAKLIILSVLGTAFVWSGKIYGAHRHNYVVNKHRQNALSTFQTFAQAAADSQTKSAVLLQATQSIFAPQDTAFSSRGIETGANPQILEILRSSVEK